MGFFSGLNAEAYDRKYRDRDLLRRMTDYFRPYKKRLVIATIAILVIGSRWSRSMEDGVER